MRSITRVEREEVDHAYLRAETDGNGADSVCDVYESRSSAIGEGPGSTLHVSITAIEQNGRSRRGFSCGCFARPSEVVRIVHGDGEWVQEGVFRLRVSKTDRARLPRHLIVSDLAAHWLGICRPHWSRLDSSTIGRSPVSKSNEPKESRCCINFRFKHQAITPTRADSHSGCVLEINPRANVFASTGFPRSRICF